MASRLTHAWSRGRSAGSSFARTSIENPFELSPDFLRCMKEQTVPFGSNGLGKLVYYRAYSRLRRDLPDGREHWVDTLKRVVEGTFQIQQRWTALRGVAFDHRWAQAAAQQMYELAFNMKFLPPGRGLWAMGAPVTSQQHVYAALINCAFVSTDQIEADPTGPFAFLMDMSMLGVGVGFDTRGR